MGGRFARGALYIGTANWLTNAVNFAIGIAVARLLGPEAFGLYAFVLAVNEFINVVGGLAVAPALVQSREESESLYDTAYALSFAQGLAGLLVAAVVAPFLAAHRSPEAAWFLLALGLARILILLTDVPQARLDRRAHYRALAGIQLTMRTLPNFVCLGLVWKGIGPWSLVIRDLLVALLCFGAIHLRSRYRFRGRVHRAAFRSIMSYSGRMLVARIFDIFLTRFDRLVVGSHFGNAAIGLYHQARFISDLGLQATTPVSQVTFNLYARLQDETQRLRRAFALVNFFLARVLFAGAVALVIYPEETLRLLLGAEWLGVAPVLRVLGLYAGFVPLLQNLQILLYARGEVLANVRLRLLQLAVLLPGVLVAASLGDTRGVAASLVASTAVALVAAWIYSRDVVRGTAMRLFATPVLAFAGTLAGFAALEAGGGLAGAPDWLRPFLPPLAFALLVLLLDRGRLLRELRYLRVQLAAPAPGRP